MQAKLPPRLTDDELKELVVVATQVTQSESKAWFWLSVRSYYLFAAMAFVVYVYIWHRDELLLFHFADEQYRAFLTDQYTSQRFYTALATTFLYAYGFFTRHAFRMITFSVAFLATFNLFNDLFYIYDKIDFSLTTIPTILLTNRFISIIFLWMNFSVLQKLHRDYHD
jgi:hypothetical protein